MVTAALVVMTILGCDDSVSQCHYVDTVKGSWETVAACDRQSRKALPTFTNVSYPVIVAMCEEAADAPIATAAESGTKAPEPAPATSSASPAATPPAANVSSPSAADAATEDRKPLPQRAYAMIRGALPDGAKIRHAISVPVHYLGDGYSWVATRIAR